MLPKGIRDRIEERFGDKVTSRLCTAVAEDIFEKTRQMVGETSVQRWFGFTGDHASVKQRRSTLDIIANYIGYGSYDLLMKDIDDDTEISEFAEVDCLETAMLEVGSLIEVGYQPGRRLRMTYLGDGRFIVNESIKSKLRQGDIVRITHIAVGFELLIADVERDGKSLGSYRAAKSGGVSFLKL